MIEARASDWRCGAVVYQVFVDRFVPSSHLESKKGLYPSPDVLRDWSSLPKPSRFDSRLGGYPHVYEFWGGDLESLRSRLDYVHGLADVVYLNPIFKAPSNHKYDTEDYFRVDPQYGSEEDLQGLIKDLHSRGMKLLLDGVFNHVGRTNARFVEAEGSPQSPGRAWHFFDSKGYRGWAGVSGLPAYNLENPEVRQFLWNGRDSVVRHWLKLGIDGWRLDVAFEIGPDFLNELRRAARAVKKDAWIVGEVSGYPSDWSGSLDGVFNFHTMDLAIEMVKGRLSGGAMARAAEVLVRDAGIESLLRSWLLTDNHDTDRFASVVSSAEDRALVRTLQFTLPGSPCLYYGSELGMAGVGDPGCRAPMRWDLAVFGNKDLDSTRRLAAVRRQRPALRYGDYLALESREVMAFARVTDRLEDATVVLVNPTDHPVKEPIPVRIGRLMSWGEMRDLLSGSRTRVKTGILDVEVPAKTAMILAPVFDPIGGYTPYQRILDSEGRKPRP